MDPTPEQAAEGSILVKVLAAVLERLVNSNNVLAVSDPGQVTKFHALKAPGICIEAYLERIHKYACCSNECFTLALIYIDRLIQRNNFLLTELNVHRVVITAILLAAKFFDDAYYNNAYYSKVGGVLVSEMNGLEVDFLFRINFSLHVQPEMFHKYKAELVAHAVHAGLSTQSPTANALTPPPPPQFAQSQPPPPPQTPTLPQIAEALETVVVANAQQQLQQHLVAVTGAPIPQQQQQFAGGTLPQVTPTPPEQQHVEYSGAAIPIQNHVIAVQHDVYQQQQQQQQSLYMPTVVAPNQIVQGASTQIGVGGVVGNSVKRQIAQVSQDNTSFLQRANSLPPIPTQPTQIGSSQCSDYSINPPYHSAPVASAGGLALPLVNVIDRDQYQVVMNQILPLQPTLVHHNHTTGTAAVISSVPVAPPTIDSIGAMPSTTTASAAAGHHYATTTNHPYSSGTTTATVTTAGAQSMGNLGPVMMAYQ